MPHVVSNIEGFELANGWAYLATPSLYYGGVMAAGSGFFITHLNQGYALGSLGPGYIGLPALYGGSGAPQLWPLDFTAMISRVYVCPALFGSGWPANPLGLFSHRSTNGPATIARVEFDSLGEVSLNGVKSGAPWTMADLRCDMFELLTDGTTGLMQLWIEGALEVEIAGPCGRVDHLMVGDERPGVDSKWRFFDDVLIEAHRTNPAAIDFPGHGHVERFVPQAVGTDNSWTLGAGANKWTAVSEQSPDGDVSYVHNGGAANAQTWQSWQRLMSGAPALAPSACLAAGESWRALRVSNVTRQTAGAPNWHMARLRSGATVDETAVYPHAGAAYAVLGGKVWQDDPATGLPWTPAAVDGVEAGIRMDNAATGRDTTLYVQIERGLTFPTAAARAKINPPTLGPGGPTMIGARPLGG